MEPTLYPWWGRMADAVQVAWGWLTSRDTRATVRTIRLARKYGVDLTRRDPECIHPGVFATNQDYRICPPERPGWEFCPSCCQWVPHADL